MRRRFFTIKTETGGGGGSTTPTPDWYYRAVNLDGSQDLVDSGIQLFGSAITQWILFYYIDDFPSGVTRTDNNVGALYNGGAVFSVTGSRWGSGLGYGTYIKYAQNNGYGYDKKNKTWSGNNQRSTGYAQPLAIKRDGDNFLYSTDGRTWTLFMTGYYTGNAGSTLTIGMNAWNGQFRPTVDGVLEVAIWLDNTVDISDYFAIYNH